jgi:AraC family transcriptional regulator, alkane utilization regulator
LQIVQLIKPLSQFDERDVLNEVLQAIRLRSAVYCRARMTAPWGFKVEQRDHARFHYITSGRCWIQVDGISDPVPLDEGDLVILTSGQSHTLLDQPNSPITRLAELLLRLPLDQNKNFVWENGGAATTMLCGGFRLEERNTNPILMSLPPLVVIHDREGTGLRLRSAFQLVEAELASGEPGSEALVSRVSDVIFLQAVRACFPADRNRAPGLLRGLSDPGIGRALTAVHGRLEHPWTIASMAREAAMSRSAFSSRFADLVGEPPMSYVSRWRLNRAAFWLRSSDVKIKEVAGRVGYESEAALSRAFKRCFSLSPGAYRRYCAACNGDGSD